MSGDSNDEVRDREGGEDILDKETSGRLGLPVVDGTDRGWIGKALPFLVVGTVLLVLFAKTLLS